MILPWNLSHMNQKYNIHLGLSLFFSSEKGLNSVVWQCSGETTENKNLVQWICDIYTTRSTTAWSTHRNGHFVSSLWHINTFQTLILCSCSSNMRAHQTFTFQGFCPKWLIRTFIHWRRRLPCKVPISLSGAVWGSVTCPRTLEHADRRQTCSKYWKYVKHFQIIYIQCDSWTKWHHHHIDWFPISLTFTTLFNPPPAWFSQKNEGWITAQRKHVCPAAPRTGRGIVFHSHYPPR